MRERIPHEIVASILAAASVMLSLQPTNFPQWAIFISWAGTFAMGGPTKENLKKIWPVMPLGSLTGMIIVWCFQFTGWGPLGHMLIIFVFNALMMSLGRTRLFRFVPGMFLGFASFFATYFGGWGPAKGNLLAAFIAVVIMNFLGPIFAWLTSKLTFPVKSENS